MEFVIAVGCYALGKEDIFADIHAFHLHSVMEPECGEYFGFRSQEVDQILETYDLPSWNEEVKKRYGGYRFGGDEVTHPWEFMRAVFDAVEAKKAGRPFVRKGYRKSSDNQDILMRFLSMAESAKNLETVQRLLDGKAVLCRSQTEWRLSPPQPSLDTFWMVLLMKGVLTAANRQPGSPDVMLVIPNEEGGELFGEAVIHWGTLKAREDEKRQRDFCEAVESLDPVRMEQLLGEILKHLLLPPDTRTKRQKEGLTRGILLGLLCFQSNWHIDSQELREGGFVIAIEDSD